MNHYTVRRIGRNGNVRYLYYDRPRYKWSTTANPSRPNLSHWHNWQAANMVCQRMQSDERLAGGSGTWLVHPPEEEQTA